MALIEIFLVSTSQGFSRASIAKAAARLSPGQSLAQALILSRNIGLESEGIHCQDGR
jgi:hypothetical protein